MFSFGGTLKDKGLGKENQMFHSQKRGSGVSSVPGLTLSRVQVCLDLEVSGACSGCESCLPHVEAGDVAEWFLKAPLGSDPCV